MLGYQMERSNFNIKDFHNGWYNTGDVAFVDNDRLSIHSRKA